MKASTAWAITSAFFLLIVVLLLSFVLDVRGHAQASHGALMGAIGIAVSVVVAVGIVAVAKMRASW